MAAEVALKRLSDADWRAHLQSGLTRIDALIAHANARVAEHAAHMATLERRTSPELYAVSRDVQ